MKADIFASGYTVVRGVDMAFVWIRAAPDFDRADYDVKLYFYRRGNFILEFEMKTFVPSHIDALDKYLGYMVSATDQ